MNLPRLQHDPAALVDFYQESLEHLGAVCERTWFDRLQLVAEGRAARIWSEPGVLYETELHFAAPDSTTPRDAARDVFPGCPLTFHLAETLLPGDLALERAVLAPGDRRQAPSAEVGEKLWRAQWPGDGHWHLESAFTAAHHFSLLALLRCEVQAIDQHWSLQRLVISLPGGEPDDALAAGLDLADWEPEPDPAIAWPALDPARFRALLLSALEVALAAELGVIRARQERHLRRELDRVDDYFEGYAHELRDRAARSHSANTKLKADERLAAAKAEHGRRRQDQIQRHEIRVLPRLDALVSIAEPAWEATVTHGQRGDRRTEVARFVPRARRWFR